MHIGVPKEIKTQEYRVGMTPASVRELTNCGHQVLVETLAGNEIGLDDGQYRACGAEIVNSAAEVFERSDMIIKVKEPQPQECKMLHENQVLFTYLHLAADPKLTELLVKSKAMAIAYETVTGPDGGLPLLLPMSEVAGRMSIQAGARCLEKEQGGKGLLLGGTAGTPAAKVLVIGGGVVGTNAIRIAIGMEAAVTVLDSSLKRLYELDTLFGQRLNTIYSTADAFERYVLNADLVIGAILVPGAAASKLITRELVTRMSSGSALVDVAIDQGGCAETSRPTTHDNPTYIVDGVVHYCVANMPGAVPGTSTFALNNATLSYVLELANKGYRKAMIDNPHLMAGLNVCGGKVTYKAVAKEHGYDYCHALELIS